MVADELLVVFKNAASIDQALQVRRNARRLSQPLFQLLWKEIGKKRERAHSEVVVVLPVIRLSWTGYWRRCADSLLLWCLLCCFVLLLQPKRGSAPP